jgi:hypothetical protein
MPIDSTNVGECRVLVLSQLGGSTKYESDDNFIGLAHYLSRLEKNERPDFVAIIGGVIPDVPRKSSRDNFKRLLVVEKGVANIEDAAAVIKPHLERILKELPQNAQVVYAFGKEDIENIKHLEDLLIYEFNYNPEGIAKRIEIIYEGISSRKAIVKSTIESRKALKAQLKNASNEERLKLLEELDNIEFKIKINKEEASELELRAVLLTRLYENALTKMDPEQIKDSIKKEREKLREIREEMRKIKEEGGSTDEYNRLKGISKGISSKLRAFDRRLNESVENYTTERLAKSKSQALIFTRQIPITKSAADLIHDIAVEAYKSTIRYAFGRRNNLILQVERVAEYKVNGHTIVLESPIEAYKLKGNVDEASILYKYMENGTFNIGKDEDVVFIRGRNLYTNFKFRPLLNNSKGLLTILNQGPFIDLEKLAMLYNRGIITDETKVVEKGLLSSAATMLSINNGTPKIKILDSSFLANERLKSDIEEQPKLEQLLKMIESHSKKEQNGNGAFKQELELAILSNKRPSEIKERELKYASESLVKGLLRNGEVAESKVLKVAFLQDIHMGNYVNMPMLKAAIRDIAEKKPDIIIMSEIIEGNHNNYKNVQRQSSLSDDSVRFREFLEKQGLSKEEVNEVMLAYYQEKEMWRIYNIDEQTGIVLRLIAPTLIDFIKRGGYLLFSSGNHYNKSEEGWQFDEATRVRDYLFTVLESLANELPLDWKKHIKIAPGSEYGSDTFTINYKGDEYVIEIAHEMPKNAAFVNSLIAKKSNAKLIASGHHHVAEGYAFNGKIAVFSPAIQRSSDDPFLKRTNTSMPSEDMLNGYTYAEFEIGSGKVLTASVENRFKNDLKDKMEQIEAKKELFYNLFRKYEKTIDLNDKNVDKNAVKEKDASLTSNFSNFSKIKYYNT